jgi:hypothetical protein
MERIPKQLFKNKNEQSKFKNKLLVPGLAVLIMGALFLSGCTNAHTSELIPKSGGYILVIECGDGREKTAFALSALDGIDAFKEQKILVYSGVGAVVPDNLPSIIADLKAEGKEVSQIIIGQHGTFPETDCPGCGGLATAKKINERVPLHISPNLKDSLIETLPATGDAFENAKIQTQKAFNLVNRRIPSSGMVFDVEAQKFYVVTTIQPNSQTAISISTDTWEKAKLQGPDGIINMEPSAINEDTGRFLKINERNAETASKQAIALDFKSGQSFNNIVATFQLEPVETISSKFAGADPEFAITAYHNHKKTIADLTYGFDHRNPGSNFTIVAQKSQINEVTAFVDELNREPKFLSMIKDPAWQGKVEVLISDLTAESKPIILREFVSVEQVQTIRTIELPNEIKAMAYQFQKAPPHVKEPVEVMDDLNKQPKRRILSQEKLIQELKQTAGENGIYYRIAPDGEIFIERRTTIQEITSILKQKYVDSKANKFISKFFTAGQKALKILDFAGTIYIAYDIGETILGWKPTVSAAIDQNSMPVTSVTSNEENPYKTLVKQYPDRKELIDNYPISYTWKGSSVLNAATELYERKKAIEQTVGTENIRYNISLRDVTNFNIEGIDTGITVYPIVTSDKPPYIISLGYYSWTTGQEIIFNWNETPGDNMPRYEINPTSPKSLEYVISLKNYDNSKTTDFPFIMTFEDDKLRGTNIETHRVNFESKSLPNLLP